MIISLLFWIFLFWILSFRLKRKRMYELASKIPATSDEIPIIGTSRFLLADNEELLTTFKTYSYECLAEASGMKKVWLGPYLAFLTTNPVDIEYGLKALLRKENKTERFFKTLLGNGHLMAPVPIWKVRRKIMSPVLAPKAIEMFMETFATSAEKLTQQLQHESGQFNVMPYISRYTFQTICEAALGINIRAHENPNLPFIQAVETVFGLITERIFHIWLWPDYIFNLFRSKYEKSCKILHDFVDETIKKNRNVKETIKDFNTFNCNNNTMLDALIKSSGGENGYSEEELREEILTLLIAATDTSAVSIAFTLVMLRKYPKIQEKVHEELSRVFKDSDTLNKENLSQLLYLDRVIKETMRLFPVAPVLGRTVTSETTLPSGIILPAGSEFLVSAWGVHRDPKHWGPNAEQFDPDRFLPERLNLPYSCCYLPFSAGPRKCGGYHYGMVSVKMGLCAILRRYKVVGAPEDGPIPSMRTKLETTQKAVNGWLIGLEKK